MLDIFIFTIIQGKQVTSLMNLHLNRGIDNKQGNKSSLLSVLLQKFYHKVPPYHMQSPTSS